MKKVLFFFVILRIIFLGLTAAEERKRRWAAKKTGAILDDMSSKQVTELTSLADSLISLGHMEAYQLNHLKINELLNKMDDKKEKTTIEFDMFDDDAQTPSSSEQGKQIHE